MNAATIYSIGHGNRSIEAFVGLLQEAHIELLVDVRAYPASRRHPQFARAALESALGEAGMHYEWQGKTMGGRRRPRKHSPHTALRNDGFRAYADHMTTDEFRQALAALVSQAGAGRTAIMCAERLPWQCHRYLIADSLVAHGATVLHLVDSGKRQEHRLNPAARAEAGKLLYDRNEQLELSL